MRGGYEIILIICIAILSTFLVSGLPFGSLPILTAPGSIVQQITTIPEATTKDSLNLNTIDIQTTFTPFSPTPAQQQTVSSCNPPASNNLSNIIQNTYHITFDSSSTDATTLLTQMNITYKTLCLLFQSQTYQSLLPPATVYITSTLFYGSEPKTCGLGFTGPDWCPKNYQGIACSAVGWCSTNKLAVMFVLAHELSHVIEITNKNNVFSLYTQTILPSETLPTFNCVHATQNIKANECFADMVAEYLMYTIYKHDDSLSNPTASFADYPTKYAKTYNFARQYIFDGIQYNAQELDVSNL